MTLRLLAPTGRNGVRALVSIVAAALAALAPSVAAACPVCATREGSGPLGTVALGALIVAPWFAALGVGFWIRRGLLEEAAVVSVEQQDLRPR